MKKILIIVLAIFVLVLIVGCSDKNDNGVNDKNEVVKTNTAVPTDKISDDDLVIDDNDLDDNDIDLDNEFSFIGVINDINGNTLTVNPNDGEDIRDSGDTVAISVDSGLIDGYAIGDTVHVIYDGDIMESNPLKVNVISMEKVE